MKKKEILIMLIALLLMSFTACSSLQDQGQATKKKVYTSIYPIYDFTKKIGGDKIEIELLTSPGAEPHSFEPSAKDMAKIEKSDLFLYNGLGLDSWAEKIAQSLSNQGKKALAVAEIEEIHPMIFTEQDENHHQGQQSHEHGIYDPHVWLDPMNAEKMAKAIKEQLVRIDSENKEYYEKNFITFQKQLKELDENYQKSLSQVEKKDFIVNHAAFGYLANRYGLNQIPITGLVPQAEPSPAKLKELTKLIKEHDINTIFMESLSSSKLTDVLSEETGVKVELLHPIGGLTRQEMDQGKEYLSLMKQNLQVLTKALSGKG
ncbi:metal ABC transporter substrate-binding protein [Garciella nitratireducens]|uniref:Zinc transport system substrate-binding protein n=1 Tax=Garciella nitratireducens DSM 15102 TaxID=1121911 RepID=A0A1T4NW17_9FIRM|nr:metal ABC transporter substrate-binding protein [Garciella nitratireducens]SJZ83560.1 zinc transport system substrate-binding protein [Garciella nitratireducens DSM 15102]